MSRLIRLLRNLFRRRHVERDLDDELSAAFVLLVDEKVGAGMPKEHACRAARLELGGLDSLKEQVRDARAGATIEALLQDLRYGRRLLRKSPTFSLVAILTLALGTGANAAVFQLANALLLRPLPVEKPQQLVSVGIDQHGKNRMGRREAGRSVFSEPLFREIQRQQQAFSSLIAWGSGRWDRSTEGQVVWADGYYVSGSYFGALGVSARLGRLFTDDDDRPGCGSPGAVLSHDFWRSRYGGDASVVGQRIMLDRRPFEVVGVAPSGFLGLEMGRSFDVAVPLCAEPLLRGREAGTGRRDVWWLDVIGRLKPGWTVERVRAHLATISRSVFLETASPTYAPTWARDYSAFTLTATSGRTGVSMLPSMAYGALWMLLGATGLVLLLTCANLANLMLARSAARGREIAVRLAIGATRPRLVGQLLIESALMAAIGALGGFLLAQWSTRALVTLLNTGSLPVRIMVDLTPDWRGFAATAFIATLVCVVCGLGPAVKATRRDLTTAMQPGSRSSTEGPDALRLRRGLVVVQLAVSIVLVVGALLFVRTLSNLNSVDLGFDPTILVASVDLRRTAVRPDARMQAFENIVARLHSVGGVRSAAETVVAPLSGADWNGRIVKGGAMQDGEVHFNAVGIDYFSVVGMPLVGGRAFEVRDRRDAPRAAVVNQTFARRFFPNEEAIGQTFQVDGPRTDRYHIVGLVRDAKFLQVGNERTAQSPGHGATESPTTFLPVVYLAARQEMIPTPTALRIVVRADLPAAAVTPALTRTIDEVVPGASVSYDTVARYVETLLLPQRLVAWLSGFFGVLAALIASVGLYGIVSYLVTRRRVEIGVRMALGAKPRDIIRMVLADSGWLVAIGLVIGTVLATVALQPTASLLYGLRPLDSTSFSLGIGVLASVGLLAAWFPARSASRVDAVVVLRE